MRRPRPSPTQGPACQSYRGRMQASAGPYRRVLEQGLECHRARDRCRRQSGRRTRESARRYRRTVRSRAGSVDPTASVPVGRKRRQPVGPVPRAVLRAVASALPGLVLSSALALGRVPASPNISTTGNGEGRLSPELVRQLAHGLVLSSALALGRVLAWELVQASATSTCGYWPSP